MMMIEREAFLSALPAPATSTTAHARSLSFKGPGRKT
jgi:hypothetical protein